MENLKDLCEKCKKNAAEVKLVLYIEGKKKIMHLCKVCAEEESMGVNMPPPSPPVPKKKPPLLKPEEDLMCANCGFKLSEFLRISKFRCEKCYESFEPHTTKILSQYHKASGHKGKVYTGVYSPNKEFKLKVLKRALDEALKREEYERAARIRDMIKEVEKKYGS